MDKRHYLKDVVPRFYGDVEAFFREHHPGLLPQLAHLYITDRCTCGAEHCSQFTCESDNPLYAPINGRHPFYGDLEGCNASACVGLSEDGILTGFEIVWDYEDQYLHRQLEAHGFPRTSSED
jgi:hypothetical protein